MGRLMDSIALLALMCTAIGLAHDSGGWLVAAFALAGFKILAEIFG